MTETFAQILSVGGKTNSLGRAEEVIGTVLADRHRLDELYECLFNDDAWIRMRAADSIEKVCRAHPEWVVPYIDRFPDELFESSQPSIQWHLAQIYRQVKLTDEQRKAAIGWLKTLLSTTNVDWIVSANAMTTLAEFTGRNLFPAQELLALIRIQQQHKSNAVVKRANKLHDALTAEQK